MISAALGSGGIWMPVDGVLNGCAILQLVVDWTTGAAAAVLGADALALTATAEPDTGAVTTDDALAIALLLPLPDAAAGTLEDGAILPEDEAAPAGVLTAWASTWDRAHKTSKNCTRIKGNNTFSASGKEKEQQK